jgi:glyoxylase-like metal-dependent hydrolase (beta-lactamase superfamily II)
VLVETDHQIEDGVHLEAAHGHTPGACFMHARSRGVHAILIGDAAHTPVQLAMPSLSSRFCFDAAASARTRIAMCERYADTATAIFAAHFPTSAAARIRRHRDAFRLDTD